MRPAIALGESIPPDTPHAVSVSLPTWSANVGYEEGQQWVTSRMSTGYPRFFIHKTVETFARDIVENYGSPSRRAILFPSASAAQRCVCFVRERVPAETLRDLEILQLSLDPTIPTTPALDAVHPSIWAVLCPEEAFPVAKEYWQHTGDGVSSRRAEFCHRLFQGGLLVCAAGSRPSTPDRSLPGRGPRRYQRLASHDTPRRPVPQPAHGAVAAVWPRDVEETSHFIEERFGRNLDLSLLGRAKSAIKRRIAGALTSDVDAAASPAQSTVLHANSRGVAGLDEGDVYLYPCGMNAIFHAHRYLLTARGPSKSINLGFPYVDTLKILQKFGPGCVFYGHASEQDLDALERRLAGGERFLALFCEFPGNPLLTCPNLARVRALADRYDFAVVIDETVGTFANINVLPFADIVVSSLTKIFSGDCNVMGGCAILNPGSRYYAVLQAAARADFEDLYWPEDVIFMERNSRDFASRVSRINTNAEAICDVLSASRLVRAVHYPKCNPSAANFEACRLPAGGYGGLLSVVFHIEQDAITFYDVLETAKGPSLGTNFTLTSPYVLLAHYQELDWAASLGVEAHLIRISVGLEDTADLVSAFTAALEATQQHASPRPPA